MLQDLLSLSRYFDWPQNTVYEDDLIRRYGPETVSTAIRDGLLAHGWIPCGQGRRRCVCHLSLKGQAQVESEG